MRVVAEIPHHRFKITVFSWNGKYILRIGIDAFEQTFKVKEDDIAGVDGVKALVDDAFLDACMQCFLSMRSNFLNAYKSVSN